jgi:hypothetical protein
LPSSGNLWARASGSILRGPITLVLEQKVRIAYPGHEEIEVPVAIVVDQAASHRPVIADHLEETRCLGGVFEAKPSEIAEEAMPPVGIGEKQALRL